MPRHDAYRHPQIPPDRHIPEVPDWYVDLDDARVQFGELVERVGPYFMQGDPLADELIATLNTMRAGKGTRMFNKALEEGIDAVRRPPPALVEFFREVDRVPLWVDWNQIDRGGRILLRAGPLGALVLLGYSLPLAYSSPDGNKPLVFSGRLVERAHRRMTETARYVVETCKPGGLERFSPGFKITIKVRLMHAQVRRLLLQHQRWDLGQWGMPINQAYLAGTNTLFAGMFIHGLRKLGLKFTASEEADLVTLWRYAGKLIGVDDDLCAVTVEDGIRLIELILAVQKQPDEDAQALCRALMEVPLSMARNEAERMIARSTTEFLYAVSRYLVGDSLADQLGYPRSTWRMAIPPIRASMGFMSMWQRLIPQNREMLEKAGIDVWEHFIEHGLKDIPATFQLPTQLANLSRMMGRPTVTDGE